MPQRHPFESAPVGSAALEVCAACGQETGTVLVKSRGPVEGTYSGPQHVATADSRCEFCHFISIWCAHEGHDLAVDGKVGAAKIVELVDGAEKLVAFVPFTEKDERNATLADGTPYTIAHGMALLAERREDGLHLMSVLRPGV